jgi:hypothetical protein
MRYHFWQFGLIARQRLAGSAMNVFWCGPNISLDFCILQVVVVRDVTDSGEELLHRFIFSLLHAGVIGDDNTVVSLDPKILEKGCSYGLEVVGVDFDH